MRKINILKMMSGIDDKFIKLADEDFDPQNAQHGMYITVERERFPWRAVFVSAACTAAVLVGIFAALLNVGKLDLINNPDCSTGVSLDGNSNAATLSSKNKYGLDLSENMSGEITVNCAYGYEKNSDKLSRFEIGDKFGANAEITSAKSTFLVVEGNPVLLKQELTIAVNYMLAYSTAITEKCLNELDLPSFGSRFKTNPLFKDKNDGNLDSDELMLLTTINIDVDYSDKTITPYTHEIGIIDGGH